MCFEFFRHAACTTGVRGESRRNSSCKSEHALRPHKSHRRRGYSNCVGNSNWITVAETSKLISVSFNQANVTAKEQCKSLQIHDILSQKLYLFVIYWKTIIRSYWKSISVYQCVVATTTGGILRLQDTRIPPF